MASDSWRSSTLRGWRELFSEVEEGEGVEEEFGCPFCCEDYDFVGLCCHIEEEHPVEAKNGVCPICMASVGLDMVGHLTIQHANFYKMQRRRRYLKGGSSSPTETMFSTTRKDYGEGNIRGLHEGSSSVTPKSVGPDPFLSSLIYSLPGGESPEDAKPESPGGSETNLDNKSVEEKVVERAESTLSEEEQKELALRRKFVQGLLLSTILGDPL